MLFRSKKILFIGGTLSYIVYGIVVWGFTQAPIALVIGVWWEIYEVLIYFTILPSENYLFDTITDLLMDSAGGLTASVIYLWLEHDLKQKQPI